MLALATGWTDETIATGISDRFRRACHHALFAQALAEVKQSHVDVLAVDDAKLPAKVRAAVGHSKLIAQQAIATVTAWMYPEDEPVG